MTERKLSTITLQTIENYRTAAEHAVKAYRFGGHRLIGLLDEQLGSSFYPRADKVLPAVSEQVYRLQHRAFELTGSGIDRISENTERLVAIGANGAATGVHKAADRFSNIMNPYLAKSLDTMARLNLPSAQLALAISVKLSEGAQNLSAAAAGPVTRRAATTARKAATTTRRRATMAAKSTAKRATTAKKAAVRKTRTAAAQAQA